MNLQPTFTGVVVTTQDALILFQAVLSGILPQVSRRPHDRERSELIRSGSVFIFNEQQSGIKRWTDGIAWSPSRIYENFLLYRQLEKPFSPGEKKRTAKRGRKKYSYGGEHPYDTGAKEEGMMDPERIPPYSELPMAGYNTQHGIIPQQTANGQSVAKPISNDEHDNEKHVMTSKIVNNFNGERDGKMKEGEEDDEYSERALVGSLIDSYAFKGDGLIKRTMSIVVNGQAHHLVSYYNLEEAKSKRFSRPSKTPGLKDIEISEELTSRQNFRVPLDANGNTPAAYGDDTRSIQRPTAGGNGAAGSSHYYSPGQQQPQMDLAYEMDIPLENNYYRNGMTGVKNEYYSLQHQQHPVVATTGNQASQSLRHPTANSGHSSYVSGYRPFGSAGLPLPQSQPLPFPHYQYQLPPQGEYYYGRQPPQADMKNGLPPNTVATNGSTTASKSATSGNNRTSPSLPPLPQPQGYSYQSYVHDYNTQVGSGLATNDPRKLPDSIRRQQGSHVTQVPEQQQMHALQGQQALPGQHILPASGAPQQHAIQGVVPPAAGTGQPGAHYGAAGGYGYGYAPVNQGW